MMLFIDKLILSYTEHHPDEFTGGAIQSSISKHSRSEKNHLLLFFGYDKNKNPITKKIEIERKDKANLIKDLELKNDAILNAIFDNSEMLNYNAVENMESYEVVRSSNDITIPLGKGYGVDGSGKLLQHFANTVGEKENNLPQSNPNDSEPNQTKEIEQTVEIEAFYHCWNLHSKRLSECKTVSGNPRRNNNKGKCKERFLSLAKKYKLLALTAYIKDSTYRDSPKEFQNLVGKDFNKGLVEALNKHSDDDLLELVDDYKKSDFLNVIELLENEQI